MAREAPAYAAGALRELHRCDAAGAGYIVVEAVRTNGVAGDPGPVGAAQASTWSFRDEAGKAIRGDRALSSPVGLPFDASALRVPEVY